MKFFISVFGLTLYTLLFFAIPIYHQATNRDLRPALTINLDSFSILVGLRLFCSAELKAEKPFRANYQAKRKGGDHHFADSAHRKRSQALLTHFAKVGSQADARESEQKRPA